MPTKRENEPLQYCVMVSQQQQQQQQQDDNNQERSDLKRFNVTMVFWSNNSDDWRRIWSETQYCDYMATNRPEGLLLADSLGIPAVILVLDDNDGDAQKLIDEYESGRQRQQQQQQFETRRVLHYKDFETNLTDPEIYGIRPGTAFRPPIAQAQPLVDSFPFELFTTTKRIQRQDAKRIDTATAAAADIVQDDDDDNNNSHHNRTLVVVMGSLRGGEAAWQSLYRRVLDVNQADLALIVGQRPENARTSMYERAKYRWEFPEYDDWADAIDTIRNSSAWREDILHRVSKRSGALGAAEGRKGSGAIIFMIRYWLRQHIIRLNLTAVYHRFIITRSDFFYRCNHSVAEMDPHYLWVPTGEDYGGITDRHLVAPSGLVLKALDILEPLFDHPTRYYYRRFTINPEQLIRLRWSHDHMFPHFVKRFPRVMYVCVARGDKSRWGIQDRRYGVSEPDGCVIKYLREFEEAECNCDPHSQVVDSNDAIEVNGTFRLVDEPNETKKQETINVWQQFVCIPGANVSRAKQD